MPARITALLALLALAPLPARAQPLPHPLSRALSLPRFPRRPLLSPSSAAGAPLAWSRHGTLGESSTICVIDTGVDARHRDFRDAEGHTRIAWLVDLEASAPHGDHPALEASSGAAIWSAASIDAALAAGTPLPGDRHGHGTAIASVAAGDDAGLGEATPGPHAGVAPRAQLIIVRALRAGALGFVDDDVTRGAELCFALSSDPSRTVALLALGGHDGAHDGSEPLSLALAAIAAEGHALIVAAGNDGDRPIHAAGRAFPGAPARVTLHVPTPRGGGPEHWVALVVRGDVQASWIAPDGTSLDARPGELAMRAHAGGYLLLDAREPGTVRAVVGGGGEHAPLHAGDYTLVLGGDASSFDAWLVDAELGAPIGAPLLEGAHVVPGDSVTIPATTPALVAVAADVSLARHGTLALEPRDDGSATFSARGPSAGGAARPDLSAPGGFFAAALSSDLVPDDARNLIGGSRPTLDARRVGGDRIAVEGTSAAAAVVAGAYALAYALAPSEAPRDRALLRATAAGDDAWTSTRGAGSLDLARWLAARLASDRSDPVDAASSLLSITRATTTPRAGDVSAVARLLDAAGAPVHGGELILRARGRELARAAIAHGHAEARLAVDAPAGETIAIEAEANGVALAPRTLEVRVDEGERGASARIAGGGCAVGASGVASRGPLTMVALLIALSRARRRRYSPRAR